MSFGKKSFLILIMAHLSLCFPPESCYVGNQACKINKDNLLETVSGVPNKEGCRDICNNTTHCNYFSYFGSDSFPMKHMCSTFSNCSKLYPCDDCFSEEKFCNNTFACGDNIEGVLGENVLKMATNVEADICKMKCKKNDKCKFYTYYDEFHPKYPKTCILLSSLEQPLYPCQNCTTDTMDCYSGRVCGFQVDGNPTLVKTKLFKNTYTKYSVRIITVGLCKASFLGIGGGGQSAYMGGDSIPSPCGGGGSGEVSFLSHNTVNLKELFISVGGQQKPSVITTSNGTMVLRAKNGSRGKYGHGGNGYSGGGGDGRNGGSDGGDGATPQFGGKGNGVDISKFELQYFSLTPSAGGNYTSSFECSGGGGGVLINGRGPNLTNKGQGNGYGGGGSCEFDGSPGAIVIEVN